MRPAAHERDFIAVFTSVLERVLVEAMLERPTVVRVGRIEPVLCSLVRAPVVEGTSAAPLSATCSPSQATGSAETGSAVVGVG